jgi:hypothetical protein
MGKLNRLFAAGRSKVAAVAATVSTGLMFVGTQVQAAIDVAGVNTEISNAETSAHSVGTIVIGVVASLAVVTIVIGLVKKL